MNTLIVFPGWGETAKSNPEIKETAPTNWEVIKVSYKDLIPNVKVNTFINNLNLLLEDRGIDHFYLLGYSLGGVLALEYVNNYPNKVKHLFLVNSEGIKAPSNIVKLAANFIRSNPILFTKKLGYVLKGMPELIVHPRWNMRLIRLAEESSMEELAPKVKVPTTILWGDKDQVTPLWQGEKLHRLILKSKLIILNGFKHDWLISHPDLFWKNISLHDL